MFFPSFSLSFVAAALSSEQELKLIDVMSCAVQQAATGEYPVGRGQGSRKLTAREAKQVRDDKVELSEHFIDTLPQMLEKVYNKICLVLLIWVRLGVLGSSTHTFTFILHKT